MTISAAALSPEERLLTDNMSAGSQTLIRKQVAKIPEEERGRVVNEILTEIPEDLAADLKQSKNAGLDAELKLNLVTHYDKRERWKKFIEYTANRVLGESTYESEAARLIMPVMDNATQLSIKQKISRIPPKERVKIVNDILAAVPKDVTDPKIIAKIRYLLLDIYEEPHKWPITIMMAQMK